MLRLWGVCAVMVGVSFPAFAWEISRDGPLVDQTSLGQLQSALFAPKHLPAIKGALPIGKTQPVFQGTAVARLATAPSDRTLYTVPHEPVEGDFKPVIVEYPQATGAVIGDGWDAVTNRRLYSQCIDYGAVQTDEFQQATLDYKQAVDDETLLAALNINASVEASGGFDGITANAGAKLNTDVTSKVSSKDVVVVAHASIVNGSSFITAQRHPPDPAGGGSQSSPIAVTLSGVTLSKAAEVLLASNDSGSDFRSLCGDGFVASIATGADLYIVYNFTNLKNNQMTMISNSFEAGGGVTGIFSAKGSFGSKDTIEKDVSDDTLGIYFVQNGGEIESLPTELAAVNTKVMNLPKEAWNHGRPLYMVVVPYSDLSNWHHMPTPAPTAWLRAALARYLTRLSWASSQLQSITDDYLVHRNDMINSDYIHDNTDHLRSIDYVALGESLASEMSATEERLRDFDINCTVKADSKLLPECQAYLKKIIPDPNASNYEIEKFDFLNDYRFLVQLPIPRNAISDDEQAHLVDLKGDLDDRKYLLNISLYRHWVKKLDDQRCVLFDECLTKDQRVKLFSYISSLNFQ